MLWAGLFPALRKADRLDRLTGIVVDVILDGVPRERRLVNGIVRAKARLASQRRFLPR